MGKVNWHGDRFLRELEEGLRKNVSAASIFLAADVKSEISQPGTLRYSSTTKKGKKSKSQKTIYNFTHSARGNPPYKQSGRLRASITWELAGPKRLTGRVGSNLVYARALELRMHRPYLTRQLALRKAVLAALLTRRISAGQLPRLGGNQFRSGVMGRGTTSTASYWKGA